MRHPNPSPATDQVAAIVLAAGKGTRMQSRLPKVLHRLAGEPMLAHVLHSAFALEAITQIVVVVGPEMEQVAHVASAVPRPSGVMLHSAVQYEQCGTGDAVKAALPALAGFTGTILLLLGDVPLITPATMESLIAGAGAMAVNVAAFQAIDPTGYGRLVTAGGNRLERIVECKDASEEEKRISLCNAGLMAVQGALLPELLEEVTNHNAKNEYYLTDIIAIARRKGCACGFTLVDAEEVAGINSRAQLAAAEALLQARLRQAAMKGGATLIDPSSVFFARDTVVGQDVIIHPQVVFGPGVTIADNVEIKPFCHIEGTAIADGAVVGPFARLRPGSRLGREARIGNFVEIKNAAVEEKAKINHLSYIGDARVGARSNIGAGTITCNYDGFTKSCTDIGSDCFIGSNTSLIAPLAIGQRAVIGAGSAITEDVPADALALSRAEQRTMPGKAKKWRESKNKDK